MNEKRLVLLQKEAQSLMDIEKSGHPPGNKI
jgi:hypothetical protein